MAILPILERAIRAWAAIRVSVHRPIRAGLEAVAVGLALSIVVEGLSLPVGKLTARPAEIGLRRELRLRRHIGNRRAFRWRSETIENAAVVVVLRVVGVRIRRAGGRSRSAPEAAPLARLRSSENNVRRVGGSFPQRPDPRPYARRAPTADISPRHGAHCRESSRRGRWICRNASADWARDDCLSDAPASAA